MPGRSTGTERKGKGRGSAGFPSATDARAEVQPAAAGCCTLRVWSPSTGASVQVVLNQEQMWQMMRSYFQVQCRPTTGPKATPEARTTAKTATNGTATRRTRTATPGRRKGSR